MWGEMDATDEGDENGGGKNEMEEYSFQSSQEKHRPPASACGCMLQFIH